MARMIRHEATGPKEIKPADDGKSAWVCMCGLSKNYPLCDGSHSIARKTEEDGKLYVYDKEGHNVVEVKDDL
jgi:CDGSH-type Zn-finger protein